MNKRNKSSNENNFSVKLREIRESKGLSQEEMAKSLGIERARYSNLENGKPAKWLISAIRLHRLLKKSGYSLDDLILDLPTPEDC